MIIITYIHSKDLKEWKQDIFGIKLKNTLKIR